jgi:hypothetical protein
MALTSKEKAALDIVTGDIAQIAAELYGALLTVEIPGNGVPAHFSQEQAFELASGLITYTVNGVDEA